MPTKNQIDSPMDVNIVKEVTPSTVVGSTHNPGVQGALNTPPNQGNVKVTFYYTPNGPGSLQTVTPEPLDSTFDSQSIQAIDMRPRDDGRGQGSGAVDSPMNNPIPMKIKQ